MNGEIKLIPANENRRDTIYPWMRVVAIRNGLKESTVMRVWQLAQGSIINLRSKPGTKAAEFVTPGGILTGKGHRLATELDEERANYIRQMGNE